MVNYLAGVQVKLEDWAVGDHSHFPKENSEEKAGRMVRIIMVMRMVRVAMILGIMIVWMINMDNDKDGKLLLGRKFSFAP